MPSLLPVHHSSMRKGKVAGMCARFVAPLIPAMTIAASRMPCDGSRRSFVACRSGAGEIVGKAQAGVADGLRVGGKDFSDETGRCS